MDYRIIAAIFGLAGGLITIVVTPWIKWQFDKKRERYKNRKKFIDDVREQIIHCRKDVRFFCTTPLYSQLRHHLSKKLIEQSESETPPASLYVELLDRVHELESKWDIL
jgi:hypothetical protein